MKKLFCVILLVCIFLCGCKALAPEADWGSFTADKAYSYDEKYYALQEVVEENGVNTVEVSIYTADDAFVYSFRPARAADFWGICWEKDSHNIWTQSADVGVQCYVFADGTWSLNSSAVRPEYIISKYEQ